MPRNEFFASVLRFSNSVESTYFKGVTFQCLVRLSLSERSTILFSLKIKTDVVDLKKRSTSADVAFLP